MDDALRVKALAAAHGFPLAGLARVPDDGAAPGAAAFGDWLAQGHHGPLGYMLRTAAARQNIHLRFPRARSVLCVGVFHAPEACGQCGRDLSAHVARYARGRDYHKVLTRRLKALAAALRDAGLCAQARGYVDTGPVLERAWAAAAGLGWIGKNTCLIHPRLGSYFLLGEILLDTPLPSDAKEPNRCGSCSRCLRACPTGALCVPGVLDARRCISTWTLEQKNAVPAEWRRGADDWVAGCDRCQEACPFNAPNRTPPGDAELVSPQPWHDLTLAAAEALDEAEFQRLFQGSALRRVGWEGLRAGARVCSGGGRLPEGPRALPGELLQALRPTPHDPRSTVHDPRSTLRSAHVPGSNLGTGDSYRQARG